MGTVTPITRGHEIRRATFRLKRAQRADSCCRCGEPIDVRERIGLDLANEHVWHFDCALRLGGAL